MGKPSKSKVMEGMGLMAARKVIYTFLSIADHEVFKRLKNGLFVSTELNLYTAVLGGELTIDTMDGKVKLKVKPGTQNGKKVKLKGKGFPVYKKENYFGDLFVTYHVKIPTNFTEKQKSLFTDLSTL
jgi:curved DNA-binding protein